MKLIKLLFSIIILICLIIFTYGIFALSPILFFNYEASSPSNFLIIGHRGGAELVPENTISAIQKALDMNVDRIEIDIHQTKDNQLILMHDLTLDRTTNGHGLIKDYTLNELLDLDAGSKFNSSFQNEKIPSLTEVLNLVNGRKELIIEVKKGNEYYPNIEENLVRLIHENQAQDWIIIHSFSTKVIEKIHSLSPEIRLHKLFIGNLPFSNYIYSDHLEYFNFDNYDYISEYSINYHFATRKIINYLKSTGKKVNIWTVNDHQSIEDLLHLGVNGIITDNPTYAYF